MAFFPARGRAFLVAAFFAVAILFCRSEMTDFRFEDQLGEIRHPAGIKPAVQMVHLMLNHAGMETARFPGDDFAVRRTAAIADMGWPLHPAAQPRHGKTTFPAAFGGL